MSENVGIKEAGCGAKLKNSYFNLKAMGSYWRIVMIWSNLFFRKVLLAWRVKQGKNGGRKSSEEVTESVQMWEDENLR